MGCWTKGLGKQSQALELRFHVTLRDHGISQKPVTYVPWAHVTWALFWDLWLTSVLTVVRVISVPFPCVLLLKEARVIRCEPALGASRAKRRWVGRRTGLLQSGWLADPGPPERRASRQGHLPPHPKCGASSALTMPVTEGSELLPLLLCRVGKGTPARNRVGFLPRACAAPPRHWRGASGR